MVIEEWILWLLLAGIFLVSEMFTTGFFLMWFGIGAAAASLAAFLGLRTEYQWAIFIVVSGVLLLLSRKFADRITRRQPQPGIGADRYTGMKGIVLEKVDNVRNTGVVRIGKEEWKAESRTGEAIPAGTAVKVVRMNGTHLVVEVEEVR